MEDDIFTKVIETVRRNPAEYDITVQNITGKILSQREVRKRFRPAKILEGFVNEWKDSKSTKDSIVIAWLLSDPGIGTGKPAVDKTLAKKLLQPFPESENDNLNPELLQECIRGVIFSDEDSVKKLHYALLTIETETQQIPETTSGGRKGGTQNIRYRYL